MLTYLTSPDLMSVRLLDSAWSATGVLDIVAQADPPFHALIDTGPLITGMSNLEVMSLKHVFLSLQNTEIPNLEGEPKARFPQLKEYRNVESRGYEPKARFPQLLKNTADRTIPTLSLKELFCR